MKNNKSNSSGLSLSTAIFLIFLVLKLANVGVVATWSWLAVFSPLLISLGLALVMFAIMLVIEKIR